MEDYMKSIKLALIGLLLVVGSSFSVRAADLHFIMCGGEVREADQTVVDAFVANNPGVNVNIEAVPWGTCQDKSLTLAAAGDATTGGASVQQHCDASTGFAIRVLETGGT